MDSNGQQIEDSFAECPHLIGGNCIAISPTLNVKDLLILDIHRPIPLLARDLMSKCLACERFKSGEHTPSPSGRYVLLRVAESVLEGTFHAGIRVIVR